MTLVRSGAETAIRERLFAGVDRVRDRLAANAESDERGATLSAATVDALRECGALSMKLPAVLGGGEADLLTQFDILEALATINASAGWCAMVGATSVGWPGGFLSDAGVARMFPHGRIPTGAAVISPSGEAQPVDGGYRVKGRWGFASGIRHAEWLCAISKVPRAQGEVEIGVVVLPTDSITIEDTWQVCGLQATGSCDVVIDDVFVSEEMAWMLSAPPARGGALYRLGLPTFVAYEHAAVPLGIARRALDGLIEIARNKRRGYAPGGSSMADRGTLHRYLGQAEMRLRAARALAVAVNEEAWTRVSAAQPLDAELHSRARCAAVYATEVATDIVTGSFRYAGGSALFSKHFMQRCLRDVNAVAQHYMVSDTAYEAYGRMALGFADVNPMQ